MTFSLLDEERGGEVAVPRGVHTGQVSLCQAGTERRVAVSDTPEEPVP